jgi:hypothetical protein
MAAFNLPSKLSQMATFNLHYKLSQICSLTIVRSSLKTLEKMSEMGKGMRENGVRECFNPSKNHSHAFNNLSLVPTSKQSPQIHIGAGAVKERFKALESNLGVP